MNMKTNGNVWPYVALGSAIGGAVGYLFMTESGQKIRHSITHPDELADNLEDVRGFIESKARIVTDQVHGVLNRAKYGIEEGERAYREAEQNFQSRVHEFQGKSGDIASDVHKAVDNVNRTAVTIEQSVLDPVCELGALYRGIDRGIRAVFGKSTAQLESEIPEPMYRDTRVMGD
ncbi:MAG TPA: YtxH domain-containing protein [Terriglobia bacterium]|jgi:gas vesicle protein